MTPSREFLAILLALDMEGKKDQVSQLDKLFAGPVFDWSLLLELLLRHRVLALFVSKLREVGLWTVIPEEERARLEKPLRLVQLRQLSAVKDLIEIDQALFRGMIEFLCLKGPVLGVLLYKDPVIRHFSDLDILVRRRDVAETVAILLKLGFELCDLEDIQSRSEADPMWKHLYHVHLKRGCLHLELHWRLSRNDRLYGVSIEQIFVEKQAVRLGGAVLYTLGNVHLGDYLALHGASHCWNRLKWLCDGTLYWSLAEGPSNLSRQSESVQLMTSLVDCLWPKETSRRIGNPDILIVALCIKQLFASEEYPRALSNMLRRTRVLVSLFPSPRWKIAYLVNLLVWPEAYALVRLPRRLTFLYYIFGPLLWLKEQLIVRNADRTRKSV